MLKFILCFKMSYREISLVWGALIFLDFVGQLNLEFRCKWTDNSTTCILYNGPYQNPHIYIYGQFCFRRITKFYAHESNQLHSKFLCRISGLFSFSFRLPVHFRQKFSGTWALQVGYSKQGLCSIQLWSLVRLSWYCSD